MFNTNGMILHQETSIFPTASGCDPTNGSYVASLSSCGCQSLSLSPVYEIHADDYEGFMKVLHKEDSESDTHISLHVSVPWARLPGTITPSRLSSTAPDSATLPLSGLRFGVKDIFHVKGMKTSGGGRAYYQSYGPQNYTTQVVQKCLDGGAQMTGKTRSVGLALSSPRNGREVDFLNPWNSRGDGYQTIGGSSSGSGAAMTAYDWIDFTLGSDTGSSVRIPSRHGVVYRYKPSHGIFNVTGILVAISEQDTPGFMTRSPELFSKLGRFWAKDTPLEKVLTKFPTNLQYPQDQFTPLTQPAAKTMKIEFFNKVASTLNMTTTTVNVTASWYENDVTEGLNE
jgi:Asp-tRNA(Asn)/Glu-tRNA(Gln) amidotransferase A subunit family amidase